MLFETDSHVTTATASLPSIVDDATRLAVQADRDDRSVALSNTRIQASRPLRVMFVQTDMRVGGAEMITANIIRRLDRGRFAPELCCLKDRGELGESLANEIPVH